MRMESRLGTKAIRATPMYHCSMSARLDIALEGVVGDAGVGPLLIAYTTSDVSTTADLCRTATWSCVPGPSSQDR